MEHQLSYGQMVRKVQRDKWRRKWRKFKEEHPRAGKLERRLHRAKHR